MKDSLLSKDPWQRGKDLVSEIERNRARGEGGGQWKEAQSIAVGAQTLVVHGHQFHRRPAVDNCKMESELEIVFYA